MNVYQMIAVVFAIPCYGFIAYILFRQWFPLSGYNGNDEGETGDIDGR